MYSFSILSQITIGDIILSNNGRFKDLSIDSRSITDPKSTLFFAIKGIRHDGHHYIQELYDKGVRQFVIEYEIDHSAFPEANVFLSKSSIEVLQHVATYHRNQFKFNTIAITGSNGKTIVKEWLYQLLNPDFNIVKSP
ncbi:MAG: Mur ligase domain-containing protein, partial [Cyclobacteriaceae bacterium]|nr:Mur ligase domain-containing protein [Cyclobacteriaceae bacterium]